MTRTFRTTRPFIVISLAVAALGYAFAQGTVPEPPLAPVVIPETPLTVEEAVNIALQNNPTVTLNEQDVQVAEAQVRAARANGRPEVNLNGNATYVPSPTTVNFDGQEIQVGEKFSASVQGSITQPVWPPARWRAPVQAAQANVGAVEEELIRIRQQVAFQTRDAFFELLSAQELVQVAEYSVTVAETQLELATATFEAGTAPRLDVEQARATLANAEVNLVGAENAAEIARAALATQLGLPAGTPITVMAPEGLPTVPENVEPLVALALDVRPELTQLNFRREQLRANIELIRLQRRPLVNVGATYNQTVAGGSLFGTEGLSLSASVGFNLYNGGRTNAELDAARIQLDQIDTSTRQVALGITFEVRQAWLNLQSSLRQLAAAEQQRIAADEALRIAELRYENGEGILLEVEQARLASTQARTSLTQARYQALTAAAQLEFAVGAPVVPGAAAPPAPDATVIPEAALAQPENAPATE